MTQRGGRDRIDPFVLSEYQRWQAAERRRTRLWRLLGLTIMTASAVLMVGLIATLLATLVDIVR